MRKTHKIEFQNGNKRLRNTFDKVFLAAVCLFLFSAAVLVICIFCEAFAQAYSDTVSYFLRFVLAFVTGIFPFSIAELLILILPVAFAALIFITFFCLFKKKKAVLKKILRTIILILCCVFTVFVNTFGVCYYKSQIEKKLSLERKSLSSEQLFECALYLEKRLESLANDVEFDESGASINPHTYRETDKLINKGYAVLRDNGIFNSVIYGSSKPIMLSSIMTYTHISGIYMPLTGEANVNTNYPDYVVAYTIAHEKAHQRGIAGEDEANFMAFLACMASGDAYLEYCGVMNMYDYFLDAALEYEGEAYEYLVEYTDIRILKEMYSYYSFFKKYSESEVSKVAGSVNNIYLKTLGNDEGVKSYGLVVELAYAVLKKYDKF